MKMKNHPFLRCLIPFLTLSAGLAPGQSPSPSASLETPSPETLNRVGVSFRMGFNVKVDFKNFANPGPPTGGGIDRTYEDGYNRVNAGGNPLGLTTYWGYDDRASQYNEAAATLTLHGYAASSKNRDDDPLLGFEITYNRELFRSECWRWGVEGAFGYMNLAIHDPLISDTFAFPLDPETGLRVVPPLSSSYSGPFTPASEGTPFLGDSPSRAPGPSRTSIVGPRDFDADIYGFRLGPYAEIPFGDRVLFALSGGLALAEVCSDFSFGPGFKSGSHDDLLVGGYLAGSAVVALNKDKDWSLVGGVQFQDLGEYLHKEGGKKAVLDMSAAIFVTIGVNYSF